MSTEKIVASLLALVYVEFMSEIFRLEAQGVKLTPVRISECYRVSILKAADQFNVTQQQAVSKFNVIMGFSMTMEAEDQKARAQAVNDLIEKALKESEG